MKKNKSFQFITLLSSLVILLSVGLIFLSSQKPDAIVFPSVIDELSPTITPSASTEEPVTTGELVNEKAIGFITNVYQKDGKNYLDIDYIQFLHGQEAEDAMSEDGNCRSESCVPPNGYYIRNQNSKIRTFEIDPDAPIDINTFSLTQDGNSFLEELISFQDLENLLKDNRRQMSVTPFWIEVSNSIIVSISEQYLP